MSRYIDADVVMEVLERSAKDPRNETAMTSWANAFQELIDLLDDTLMPMATADVVPIEFHERCIGLEIKKRANMVERKCGKWLLDGRCSECLVAPLTSHKNFCPNCGADMRGDSNDGR